MALLNWKEATAPFVSFIILLYVSLAQYQGILIGAGGAPAVPEHCRLRTGSEGAWPMYLPRLRPVSKYSGPGCLETELTGCHPAATLSAGTSLRGEKFKVAAHR